jgi:hypothetical protein
MPQRHHQKSGPMNSSPRRLSFTKLTQKQVSQAAARHEML